MFILNFMCIFVVRKSREKHFIKLRIMCSSQIERFTEKCRSAGKSTAFTFSLTYFWSAFGFQQFTDTPTCGYKIIEWLKPIYHWTVLYRVTLDPISHRDNKPVFIELNFSVQRCKVSEPFFVWDYTKVFHMLTAWTTYHEIP